MFGSVGRVRCSVLRKISQHFRGPDGAGWTDRQVRLECGLPRLEVVLAQSRLLPAARIARLRSGLVESLVAG